MATTYLVLGQSLPASAILTTLYTVPASTSAVVSSIVGCNQSTTASDSIRISVAVGGAADAQKQYLYGGSVGSGLGLAPNDTFAAQLGITLTAGDAVRVYSLLGTTSFNLFGSQIA